MFDWLKSTGIGWLAGAVGAALTAAASAGIAFARRRTTGAKVKALAERVEAMEQQQNDMTVALRASMYDRLYYLHKRFMKQKWISVPDLENVSGIYEGYHGLGGNGVGTKLYQDLEKLPNFEPM